MPLEIERKFLVTGDPPVDGAETRLIEQGYLPTGEGGTEVRIRRNDDQCRLTVKHGSGLVRTEVDLTMSPADFDALWPLTEGARVTKVRHKVLDGGVEIEVDVFQGGLRGLCVAEVEFADRDQAGRYTPPAWFGREVTGLPEFGNRSLARNGRPGGDR
ncbi:CYTH domain-containing protein [Actinomadura sp. KC216]|uniref:CYTH domain-containing protein n=1 Tax=Actinomadura sp. KC216 TaxID=2530370 RepID=UPI00105372D2|nr:CYTH domain-containing protein [Actinomadura sp. KC216]TDB91383.1 CYTH domain-containing protein [Actinomadura sp. KC216]